MSFRKFWPFRLFVPCQDAPPPPKSYKETPAEPSYGAPAAADYAAPKSSKVVAADGMVSKYFTKWCARSSPNTRSRWRVYTHALCHHILHRPTVLPPRSTAQVELVA